MPTLHSAQTYRGFAAILVVCHHTHLIMGKYFTQSHVSTFFNFGHAGVEFFFVLSGFILYHAYFNSKNSKKTGLKEFIIKRFIRIYPIYWITTLTILPLWFIIPSLGESYHREIGSLIYSLVLLPQIHQPHIPVAWSLTHEIFFYLFFSIIILNRKYGSVLFSLWLAAVSAAKYFYGDLSFPLSFILSEYNLLFGFGILSGLIIRHCSSLIENHGSILFIAGNILFLSIGMNENYFYKGQDNVLLFGVASFFIITGSCSSKTESFFKNRKTFLFLGDASYSIYLIHYFLLSFACKIISKVDISHSIFPDIMFIFLSIVGIIGGCIFYLIIEKPVLAWARNKYSHHSRLSIEHAPFTNLQPNNCDETI